MNRARSLLPTPVSPTSRIGRGSGARRLARATAFTMAAEQAMTTLVATATWSTRPKPVGRPDRCDHATYGANGHNANGLRRGEGCGDCDLDIWFAAEARRCRNTDVSFEDVPRVPDVGATQHWSPARERSSPRSRGGTNRSHNGCRVSAMTFAKHPSCSSAPGCRRTRDLRRQGNEWGSSGVGSLPCERTTVAPSHP